MRVITTAIELRNLLEPVRKKQGSIGFVPTMGALHLGHISLIERSKSENSLTICSVFVNPTQFNDKKDLEKYPRPIENDIKMLEAADVDVLFLPSEVEMYPENPKFKVQDSRFNIENLEQRIGNPEPDLGILDKVMEGEHRPGHFKGVITIVSKFFDIIMPDRAYFGEKDFQQLAIIQEMVRQLKYPVIIVPCPIVREPDGLAMSSRNIRLLPEERKAAARIPEALFAAKRMAGQKSIAELKEWVIMTIDQHPALKTEYFEVVDSRTLMPVRKWADSASITGCIAVKAGDIRLIDNITLK